MEVLFYILGLLTSFFLIGMIYYRSKYKSLLDSIPSGILSKYTKSESKKVEKRIAFYKSTGWQNLVNGPNWDVDYELELVDESSDKSKGKFSIINVFSKQSNKVSESDLQTYREHFMKHSNGGWITYDNDRLTWVKKETQQEVREDKLNELGIE